MQAYLVQTNQSNIERTIINDRQININNTILINSPCEEYCRILLPEYFFKNKELFEKNGLNIELGFFETKCLKIILENERHNYDTFFINLAGFSYETIVDLQLYLSNEKIFKNKTFYIIDFDSKYDFEIKCVQSK